MKKYHYILAATLVSLASCSSDDFLGTNSGNDPSALKANEISFGGEARRFTRAEEGQAEKDATSLSKKFIVYGWKTIDNKQNKVFDKYTVKWDDTKKYWEYTSVNGQSVKYWDYAASKYDFVAFSYGSNTTGDTNPVTASEINTENGFTYTLSGKASDLVKCFVADQAEVTPSQSQGNVKLSFRSLGSNINIGLYETIEGYSVKDVKFYNSSTATSASEDGKPVLYAASSSIPTGDEKKTVSISFDNNKNAQIKWADQASSEPARINTRAEGGEGEGSTSGESTTASKKASIIFEELSKVGKEGKEEEKQQYISREKQTPSKPSTTVAVLPYDNVGALTLKVDYTLVSTDGSGETITVKGATATIGEQYTKWESNKAYTYIFKISKDTNGSTGGSVVGLTEIKFDAVVTENSNGNSSEEDFELKNNQQ